MLRHPLPSICACRASKTWKEARDASRIAAHAADIAKGIPAARGTTAWPQPASVSTGPPCSTRRSTAKKAEAYVASAKPANPSTCTMCGAMCSVRTMNRAMNGENVSLL